MGIDEILTNWMREMMLMKEREILHAIEQLGISVDQAKTRLEARQFRDYWVLWDKKKKGKVSKRIYDKPKFVS